MDLKKKTDKLSVIFHWSLLSLQVACHFKFLVESVLKDIYFLTKATSSSIKRDYSILFLHLFIKFGLFEWISCVTWLKKKSASN